MIAGRERLLDALAGERIDRRHRIADRQPTVVGSPASPGRSRPWRAAPWRRRGGPPAPAPLRTRGPTARPCRRVPLRRCRATRVRTPAPAAARRSRSNRPARLRPRPCRGPRPPARRHIRTPACAAPTAPSEREPASSGRWAATTISGRHGPCVRPQRSTTSQLPSPFSTTRAPSSTATPRSRASARRRRSNGPRRSSSPGARSSRHTSSGPPQRGAVAQQIDLRGFAEFRTEAEAIEPRGVPRRAPTRTDRSRAACRRRPAWWRVPRRRGGLQPPPGGSPADHEHRGFDVRHGTPGPDRPARQEDRCMVWPC